VAPVVRKGKARKKAYVKHKQGRDNNPTGIVRRPENRARKKRSGRNTGRGRKGRYQGVLSGGNREQKKRGHEAMQAGNQVQKRSETGPGFRPNKNKGGGGRGEAPSLKRG